MREYGSGFSGDVVKVSVDHPHRIEGVIGGDRYLDRAAVDAMIDHAARNRDAV